jgi:hypothetical protein
VSDLVVSSWDEAPDDLDGFFDEAPGKDEYGVDTKYRGRYHYPAPPGYTMPKGAKGFMRMTNMAAAFSDQMRLQHWRERMILLGIRTAEGEALYDEFMAEDVAGMDPDTAKDYLEQMADRMAKAAGSDLGARRGTARHTMLQVMNETGVLTGTRTMRLQLHSLFEALEAHYLEPIPGWAERRVCNTTYGVVGTLDMGVRCKLTGQIGILDLKTQRKFWSYLEICGQQEGYDSAQWVWEGPNNPDGRWVEAPAWDLVGRPGTEFDGRRVALLAHMPQEPGKGQLPVEIHEVALDYGAEVMRHAKGNIELRSRGASTARGRRVGAVRSVPKIVATVGLPPEL